MSDIPITDQYNSSGEAQHELAVLRAVQENERTAQRDIARRAGISLGMTNAVLKRLSQKGFLTVRRIKGRHMAYAVTPDGVHEIARRTYRYFRRTMGHVARYKEAVEALASRAAAEGYTTIALVGKSDLDFLLEHVCTHHRLSLERVHPEQEKKREREGDVSRGAFVVYAEAIEPERAAPAGVAYLWTVVTGVER